MRSLANFARVAIVRRFMPEWVNIYSIVSFIIIDGSFLIWLIYGNILFYSDSNKCNEEMNTLVLYNLMLILLIVGYC